MQGNVLSQKNHSTPPFHETSNVFPKMKWYFTKAFSQWLEKSAPFSPFKLFRRSLREITDICLLSYLHLLGSGYCASILLQMLRVMDYQGGEWWSLCLLSNYSYKVKSYQFSSNHGYTQLTRGVGQGKWKKDGREKWNVRSRERK